MVFYYMCYMAVYTGKKEREAHVQTAGNNSDNLRTTDINT